MKELFALLCLLFTSSNAASGLPNVLLLLVDDMGWGDVGFNGNTTINTPNIDALARAALLTGKYPQRVGLAGEEGTPRVVMYAAGRAGLPSGTPTFASLAREKNYSTGLVGKWHLGLHRDTWGDHLHSPLGHGFQYFFGLPFTLVDGFEGGQKFFKVEKIVEEFPVLASVLFSLIPLRWVLGRKAWFATVLLTFATAWLLIEHFTLNSPAWWQRSLWMEAFLNSFLMENHEVVQKPIKLAELEEVLVNKSLAFMSRAVADNSPFLLYHAFPGVHTPLFSGESWRGSGEHGDYGDKVREVDWAVGKLMDALVRLGVASNTLVYFASDHGGDWPQLGERGGWNGPFRGGKGNGGLEGGVRVPGILSWPAIIPPGSVVNDPTSLMDVLPTLATALQLVPPPGDGTSLLSRVSNTSNHLESRTLFHHCAGELFAARRAAQDGQVFKLLFREPLLDHGKPGCKAGICPCYGPGVKVHQPPLLYKVDEDPGEDHPLDLSLHKEVVDLMMADVTRFKAQPMPSTQFQEKLRVLPTPWLQPIKPVS